MNITPMQSANYRKTAPAKAEAAAEREVANTAQQVDKVVLSGNAPAEKPNTYAPPKKLEREQVQAIREQLTQQQQDLLKAMGGNAISQANSWLKSLGQQGRLPGVDLKQFELPPLATDPAGAKAAIEEGGAYSVDAVATRIFDMAKAMAGDDPTMLGKMKKAVQQGFKEAGLEFGKTMGQGLPDISNKTYDEVMKRFDALEKELAGTATKE